MNELYYKSSGKAPIVGVISTILAGIAVSVVLAIVYIALQWFIPIVYFNFLITFGLGFAIFYVMDFLYKSGKIRNRGLAILLTLICSLVAIYVQWCLFVSLMFNAEGTMGGDMWVKSSFNLDGFLHFIMHLNDTLAGIQELNAIGTFSLKKSVVSGGALWFVWAIEFAFILFYPLWLTWSGKTTEPFSEKDNDWMEKRHVEKLIPYVTDVPKLEEQLKARDYTYLKTHLEENEPANAFATITVYESDGDDHQYISVANHRLETNKKGEVEDKKDDVITYFKVPTGSL